MASKIKKQSSIGPEKQTFLRFMELEVLQHRQGDPGLAAASGWMVAAHAIRSGRERWGEVGEEIAGLLEETYLQAVKTYLSRREEKGKNKGKAPITSKQPSSTTPATAKG